MATVPDHPRLDDVRSACRGELLTRDDAGYEEARSGDNAKIVRHPAGEPRRLIRTDPGVGYRFAL